MTRILIVGSLCLGIFGCIPAGGGGGGGGDDPEDRGVEADAGIDPDDGVPPPDAAPDPDDGIEPDEGIDPDDGIEPDRGLDPDEGLPPDAGPDPDMAQADCVEGRVENRPCGVNGRGEATRVCADGRWSPWGCDDPDVCVDATVETRPCAGGEERRVCDLGQWSAWGACRPPPVCEEGEREVRDCGLNGRGEETRICGDGQWGPWGMCLDPDVCVDGADDGEACGLNGRGERTRRCGDGQWGPFGACDDPDTCRDGAREERACGLNQRGAQTRACNRGQWGAYGACADPDVCVDGAVEALACGLNDRGESSRSCQRGQWGPLGACEDPDECVDGEVTFEPCPDGLADGQRTCVEGQPGPLEGCGQVLCPAPNVLRLGQPVEGTTFGPSRTGGTCGMRGRGSEVSWSFRAPAAGTYTFDTSGSDYDTTLYVRATCDDPDSELDCNDDGGEGTTSRLEVALQANQQVTVFVDGYYAADDPQNPGQGDYVLVVTDSSECAVGQIEERPCLAGAGTQSRNCALGGWTEWTSCRCAAGAVHVEVCGLNDRGERRYVCERGEFPENPPCDDPDVCVDGDGEQVACPDGAGVRDRECVAGQWVEGPCDGAVCPPPAEAMLGQTFGATVRGPSALGGTCGSSDRSAEATFTFTPPADGLYTFDTSGSGYDTVLHLRTDCGDPASEIACDDDGGEGTRSRIVTELLADRPITVVVDGYNGASGEFVLFIAAGDVAVCIERDDEPNDGFDTAELIEPGFFGDLFATGALCGDDGDYYRVPVEAGCTVTATLDAQPPTAVLSSYTPDRQLLEAAAADPFVVSGAYPEAGEWFFSVEPTDGEVATYEIGIAIECPAP